MFNMANFDTSVNNLSGVLQSTEVGYAAPGVAVNTVIGFSTNCSTGNCRAGDRIGPGSGVFSLGAPRELEFGLKVRF
jgi:hypothetical protein